MIRTQIQLTKDQHARLKETARTERTSVAELVRRGVERVLEEDRRRRRRASAWQAFQELAQLPHVPDPEGATDVAEHHDKYLADSGWGRGRGR